MARVTWLDQYAEKKGRADRKASTGNGIGESVMGSLGRSVRGSHATTTGRSVRVTMKKLLNLIGRSARRSLGKATDRWLDGSAGRGAESVS